MSILKCNNFTSVSSLLFFLMGLPLTAYCENNNQFSYGGMIKFDAIFSQYSDSQRAANVGDDFLVPSTIPTGSGNNKGDTVYDSNGKFSRLWFKTITNSSEGEVKSYIEMDFNGANDERLTNQSSNGLRHAFLQWKNSASSSLLAGQTWSTFFNVSALPEAVDFIGPTSGSVFVRQTQFRYSYKLATGKLMLAAENPSVSLYDGGSGFDNNQVDSSSFPDIIARYDGKVGSFNYSAAMMLRDIQYNDGSNDDSKLGSALTFSAVYSLPNRDDIKFMLSQGHLGRYLALNAYRDGTVEANGDIELISSFGSFIAYRHFWSDQLRTTLAYAISNADNPDSVVADVTKSVNNHFINLMYSPIKKLTFGFEYHQAQRELESGSEGSLTRIQFTSKWVF